MEVTPWEVEVYTNQQGQQPFTEWLSSLKDTQGANKILLVIFSRRYSIGQIMGSEKMTRSVPFSAVLNEHLKDPEKAIAYLQSALEEGEPELFLATLRDVASAQGVLSKPASELPELSKLMESFRRHGVSDEVITAILAEVTSYQTPEREKV